MKVLFLALLITTTSSYSQLSQMKIEGSPEKSQDELVSVRDANGRFCAAIKFISDMDGFLYDSYNGVVKIDNLPGMDIVYLSPDERVVQVLHTGYKPLKIILSEHGVQLHEKELWVFSIKGDYFINILTQPTGVDIYLDGQFRGKNSTQAVGLGEHRLTLKKDGFQTVDETISVNPRNLLFRYSLVRAPIRSVKTKDTTSNIKKENSKTWLWVAAGVTVAALVTYYLLSDSDEDKATAPTEGPISM